MNRRWTSEECAAQVYKQQCVTHQSYALNSVFSTFILDTIGQQGLAGWRYYASVSKRHSYGPSAGSVVETLIQHQEKKECWWSHNFFLVQYNCFAQDVWKVWFHTFDKVPQKTSWELSATRCSIHGKLAFTASCHFNLFIHARRHMEVSKRCRLSFFFFSTILTFSCSTICEVPELRSHFSLRGQ